MHSSGGTKENYEASVAGVQVEVSSQDLPHTKQENNSLNRDPKWPLWYNGWFFITGKSFSPNSALAQIQGDFPLWQRGCTRAETTVQHT
jgi:hypothetical protein